VEGRRGNPPGEAKWRRRAVAWGSTKISMRLLPSPLGRARGARGRRVETGKREVCGLRCACGGRAAAAHAGGVVFYLRTRALRCGIFFISTFLIIILEIEINSVNFFFKSGSF
jgi:hypothetical protein